MPQLGESHPRTTTFFVCAPLTVLAQSFNGWEGSRRNEAYRHADHQIRDWAPSQRFDGMAHPTQERLCHRGTHGWKQSLWFVLISGRNNQKKSPGWLVSLVIGDYLAWFGEHLLGTNQGLELLPHREEYLLSMLTLCLDFVS